MNAKRSIPSQRGAALYVVTIALMLCVLLSLWATRSAVFMEIVTRNDADYQRAFEAAQSMLEDAKADIALHLQLPTQGHTRTTSADALPTTPAQWNTWLTAMAHPTSAVCAHGVCYRSMDAENFWDNEQALTTMLTAGARYGDYSGHGTASTQNLILHARNANQGAWYWIEPMPLQAGQIQWPQQIASSAASPAPTDSMLFRITALAFGLKASSIAPSAAQRSPTMAVLQSMVVVPLAEDAATGYVPAGPLQPLQWRQMQ